MAVTNIVRPPSCVTASIAPGAKSKPSGFVTWILSRCVIAPVSRPGVIAKAIVVTAGAAKVTTPIARHRREREGSLPSGKSRKTGTKTPSVATRSQRSSQAPTMPRGSDPGCVTRARSVYAPFATNRLPTNGTTKSSHPIVFRGWRRTIRHPIAA